MRTMIFTACLLSACAGAIPSFAPGTITSHQQRGMVEVIVKSNPDTIIAEIASGGGPALFDAMNAAGIPTNDQPARIRQLQGDLGIYTQSPAALVTTLLVYGSDTSTVSP